MKMGSAKLCELLAASFLFLTLWTDPTAACSCAPDNALKQYCRAKIAVKLQLLGVVEIDRYTRRYKIKVTKVFKGPKSLKTVNLFSTSRTSDFCFYEHHSPLNQDEYVFTGSVFRNVLTTEKCDFHKKWNSLSHEDKSGFKRDFKKKCD